MYRQENEAKEDIQSYTIYGDIAGIAFTDENLIKGATSFSNQCCGTSDFQYGGVYIGQMKASFVNMNIPRNEWAGKDIGVGVTVNDSDPIPVGIYRIDSVTHSEGIAAVTAYDYMSLFDEPMSVNTASSTTNAFDLLKFCCDSCGITMEQTREQIQALPNGSQSFTMTAENDIETYRDLIHWVAQTLGAFATINRFGQLSIRTFHSLPDDTITMATRYKESKYGDEILKYTAFTVTDIEENEEIYYRKTPDDGRTMALGSNPFIQGDDADRITPALLQEIGKITYTPCEVEIPFGAQYDLGDVLSFPPGSGILSNRFLLAYYSWTYGGAYKIKSVPVPKASKTKTDKNVTTVKRKTANDKIRYYIFKNMEDVEIEDGDEEKIIEIRFQTTKATTLIFQAEVLCDVETTVDGINYTDAVLKATYKINHGEIEDYYPTQVWQDGKRILHLVKFFNITTPANITLFEVYLEVNGGTVRINEGQLSGCIYGQNLYATDKWGGEVEDEAEAFILPVFIFGSVSDSFETE